MTAWDFFAMKLASALGLLLAVAATMVAMAQEPAERLSSEAVQALADDLRSVDEPYRLSAARALQRSDLTDADARVVAARIERNVARGLYLPTMAELAVYLVDYHPDEFQQSLRSIPRWLRIEHLQRETVSETDACKIVRTIGAMENPPSNFADRLKELFESRSEFPYAGLCAASCLARLDLSDSKYLDFLIAEVDSKRAAAFVALGGVGPAAAPATEQLTDLLDSESHLVRTLSAAALVRIEERASRRAIQVLKAAIMEKPRDFAVVRSGPSPSPYDHATHAAVALARLVRESEDRRPELVRSLQAMQADATPDQKWRIELVLAQTKANSRE